MVMDGTVLIHISGINGGFDRDVVSQASKGGALR